MQLVVLVGRRHCAWVTCSCSTCGLPAGRQQLCCRSSGSALHWLLLAALCLLHIVCLSPVASHHAACHLPASHLLLPPPCRLMPATSVGEHSPGSDASYQPVRTLGLEDWGHKVSQTGPVSAVAWSPDCCALAAGYRHQGVVVWSPSGCRLMCSLRQTPALQSGLSGPGRGPSVDSSAALGRQNSSSSSVATTTAEELSGMLEGGISALAWGPLGYQVRWPQLRAMLPCCCTACWHHRLHVAPAALGKHSCLAWVQRAAGAQQAAAAAP